jgi:hypothetical protein
MTTPLRTIEFAAAVGGDDARAPGAARERLRAIAPNRNCEPRKTGTGIGAEK